MSRYFSTRWGLWPYGIAPAWIDYELGSVGSAGIVDHVSFFVMCRLGLTEAFTNHRHLTAAGFTVLF
jgi:hypothetical protein